MIQRLMCFVISCVLCAAGNSATLNEKLEANLLCRNDPTKAGSWLYLRIGENSSEATVVLSGEEVGHRIDVQLKVPIDVEGAIASTVTWQGEGDPDAFGAILVAEFEGDYKIVARHLNLVPSGEKDTFKGVFLREISNGTLCAPTILLKPISESRFKLGCGWCNGG